MCAMTAAALIPPETPQKRLPGDLAIWFFILAEMLAFAARHGIASVTEVFPMSKVNDAMERLKSGRARYRLVLENDIAG